MQQKIMSTVDRRDDTQLNLRVQLLGPFEVILADGTPLDLGSRKAQALFAYIIMMNKPVPRDTLAAFFWSEMTEQAAKNNLRTTLALLKRSLVSFLDITSATVTFHHSHPYSLDAEAFQHLAPSAIATQNLAKLQKAVDLYKGDFLEGFHIRNAEPFTEWLLLQREQLHLLLTRTLEAIVTVSLQQRSYTIGVTAGQRLLTMVPWLETAHRRMMQLFALSGQRVQALDQYQRCAQLLEAELGVAPSRETTTLYEQIRSGQFDASATTPEIASTEDTVSTLDTTVAPNRRASPQKATAQSLVAKPPIPHNLNRSQSAFIGRQVELDFINQQLRRPDCRLVTVVGPGGIGKTSLALAAADRLLQSHDIAFPDGIFFVPLSSIEVPPTVASSSGLPNRGMPENGTKAKQNSSHNSPSQTLLMTAIATQINCEVSAGQPLVLQLQAHLRERRLLLILDNFEHLLPDAHIVVSLLTHAPHSKAVITSRARLNLRGETVLTVDKLSLPLPIAADRSNRSTVCESTCMDSHGPEPWQQSEAFQMFVQRVQLLEPKFSLTPKTIRSIVRICLLLDGLPLGIELATSMLSMMSCAELAEELAESLGVLTTEREDFPREQRTLQAVFTRSWRLLSVEEQLLLAKLSIFPSTFCRAAAQTIASATLPLLMRLVSHSLLRVDDAHGTYEKRFAIHPVIREFVSAKLQQTVTEHRDLDQHYASFYLNRLVQCEEHIHSAKWQETKNILLIDIDNIRAALRVAMSNDMWKEITVAFTVFNNFFADQGWFEEAMHFCQHASERLAKTISDLEEVEGIVAWDFNVFLGRLLTMQGWYAVRTGQADAAEELFQHSLLVLRRTVEKAERDPRTDVDWLCNVRETLGSCLTLFGTSQHWQGKTTTALELLQEAIPFCRKDGDKLFLFHGLAMVTQRFGNYSQAQLYGKRGLALAEQLGDQRFIAFMMTELGRTKQSVGEYATAQRLFEACYELRSATVDQVGTIFTTVDLADIARLQGDFELAHVYLQQSLVHIDEVEFIAPNVQLLWALGNLALAENDYAAAKVYFLKSQSQPGFHPLIVGLPTLGWAYIGLADFENAETYFREVVRSTWESKTYRNLLEGVGALLLLLGIGESCGGKDLEQEPTFLSAHLSVIEEHPATTSETSARIRAMHLRLLDGALPVGNRLYRPTPTLRGIVEDLLTKLEQTALQMAATLG